MSFQVEIEKLVYGGQGLARWNGRVVLAPFVLPGEKVLLETQRESAGLLNARPLAVEAPAEWRVAPPCQYFARCGGCQYQHIPYERQLEFKRDILLESLARLGKITWGEAVEMVSAEPWGYRNRVQLHLRKQGAQFEIGYHRFGTHSLLAIDSCPIASPALNRAIEVLRRMGPDRRFPEFLRALELFTNEQEVQLNVLDSVRPPAQRFFDWCAGEIEGFCRAGTLDYAVGADVFRVGNRSFFQVNRFLAAPLAELAARGPSGGTALDLYSGAGLFSLGLARQFSRVVAVDSSRSATRDLEFNAARAGVTIEVHRAAVDAFLDSFQEPVDFLLADPPRAGLGRTVCASIARLRPRRLTVVSCDPSTLARDLRLLVDAGFQISSVKLVDLFPQTFHIESVVELT